ncbi:trypsin beta [Drosophila mojavensis]|nr:trypsin beta [Drosophila mojavensis]
MPNVQQEILEVNIYYFEDSIQEVHKKCLGKTHYNSDNNMIVNWTLIISLQLLSAIKMAASRSPRFRIVRGKIISIKNAPWQVSLQVDRAHVCGGSLLSPSVIVTAAHCTQIYSAEEFRIRAGSNYWNSGGQVVQVKKITEHPMFNAATFENDVAILHLRAKLKLNRFTKSIHLASKEPQEGDRVSVSGWGATHDNSTNRSPVLLHANLKIISRQSCSASGYAKKERGITSGMICTSGNHKDACQGDSGGPLVKGGKLVGIVSWGIGCARKDYPGVYTNVAHYRNWILSNKNN